MKSTTQLILVLATFFCAADAAPAQWRAVSGSLDRVRGNDRARSHHQAYGVVVSSPYHAYARTSVTNSARLLGHDIEGGYIRAETNNNNRYGTRRAQLTTRAGGNQVRNERFTSSFSRNLIDFRVNLFPVDPQLTVVVGIISVTIAANAGVWLRADVDLRIRPSSNTVSIGGRTYASLYGFARVMIGFSFFGAGVEAQLQFGRTQLDLGLTARTGFAGGTATATFSSYVLKIVAFVQTFFRLGEVKLIETRGPEFRVGSHAWLN